MFIFNLRHDTEAELELVKTVALDYGAFKAVVSDGWAQGGAGAIELADAVIEACKQPSEFKFLYELDAPIEEKIVTVASDMYGAGTVSYGPKVKEMIKVYTDKVISGNIFDQKSSEAMLHSFRALVNFLSVWLRLKIH